jgi:hypothetical protein
MRSQKAVHPNAKGTMKFQKLLDSESKGKSGRKAAKTQKKKIQKPKNKINELPKVQKLGSPEAHGEKPFVALRIRISHCFDSLAVTYAEKISDDSRRKSLCWQSWSAAISQINRQA